MSRDKLRTLLPFVCPTCTSTLPLRPSLITTFSRNISDSPRPAAKRPSLDEQIARTAANSGGYSLGSNFSISDALSMMDMPEIADPNQASRLQYSPPHRIHIFATKHNTHMTLTAPAARKLKPELSDIYKPPEPNRPLMTYATGMIGFKKSGRGTYDAAYQLASYFIKQIQERGLLRDIKEVEVVLRGFGSGREAATKVILGQEGRLIRSKIVAVTDSTRLKFGGSRSPNPRRLG
ncbi:hypothetical protein ANO11243_000880 [Dothideomycetidae sp. 11243]|nr:hypothetical protein ANO11243_000880 [fungal sp. No.11243]